MDTRFIEVRREAWASFLDHLGRQYKGRRVTLHQSGRAVGPESMVDGLPLLGICADETCEGMEPTIRVMLGSATDGSVTEYLAAPTHVRVTPSAGHDGMLEIESGTGQTLQIMLTELQGLPCLPTI